MGSPEGEEGGIVSTWRAAISFLFTHFYCLWEATAAALPESPFFLRQLQRLLEPVRAKPWCAVAELSPPSGGLWLDPDQEGQGKTWGRGYSRKTGSLWPPLIAAIFPDLCCCCLEEWIIYRVPSHFGVQELFHFDFMIEFFAFWKYFLDNEFLHGATVLCVFCLFFSPSLSCQSGCFISRTNSEK